MKMGYPGKIELGSPYDSVVPTYICQKKIKVKPLKPPTPDERRKIEASKVKRLTLKEVDELYFSVLKGKRNDRLGERYGISSGQNRLSVKEIIEIHYLKKNKVPSIVISKVYNITYTVINEIKRGWFAPHITDLL